MAKNLVIVESPAKAKKINSFLGKDYAVRASVGHVRDLPAKTLGVDVENGFEPQYVETARGKKVVKELKELAAKCESVYLAPDPDREGEAIAWHLFEVLKTVVPEDRFFRVTYNEITKAAILKAFEHPSKINQHRVDSQQARRVLDRLVGYAGSPVVRRQIRGANSVGRVQTVALRLVVERERAVQGFTPEAYWVVGAKVRKLEAPLVPFTARLTRIDGEPVGVKERMLQKGAVRTQEQLEALCADLEHSTLNVVRIEEKEIQRRPQPPFITSSLQQAASGFLSYAPSRTMGIAQKLYEAGLITYMRTDSFNIAKSAQDDCLAFVRKTYGPGYAPDQPNVYRSKGGAQEAHEAIRPTDITQTPGSLEGQLEKAEWRLYDLIWKRFAASQMTPARILRRSAEMEAGSTFNCLFRAGSSEIVFPGYMQASGIEAPADKPKNGDEDDAAEETALPPLKEGERLETLEWEKERKETRPPPRYTEASLIRELEENGVGRPSTYAAIMSKLNEREYVTQDKRTLIPTELGTVLIDLIESTARKLKKDGGTDLFDPGFTAGMEEKLDRVETGEVEWHRMMQEFYPDLQHWIEQARETADPDQVALMLEALGHVKKWELPVKRGRRTYDDAETVADLRKEVAEGRRLTAAQGRMLHALACRYMEQVPSALSEKLNLEVPAAPRDETAGKLALFEGVAFDEPRKVGQRVYDDGKFVRSILRQVESRKRLSEKQVAALDRLLLKYADRISNFEERREKLGIREPEKQEADPHTTQILDLLAGIQTWNPPKGKFDDHAFYDSLRSQFESRGALSPRQFAALKKMVQRYASQIPDYAAKAEAFGLPLPRQG